MCYGCWQEAGSPQIDNPQVRQAAGEIREVYEEHAAGGSLHIIVDDWNVSDDHLDFCDKQVVGNAFGYPDEQLNVERRCLAVLRPLTEPERYSALALHDGFWNPIPCLAFQLSK